ncbi:MAG: MFS transporter [Saccharopolyspora sp.]|uniref:MFS transporter n=1 Tax=Saccharopolyspora sp. TaxID=33915 RepID=UPI0025F23598|nr:MFS transporter [Saccharopolyspora sp.]MBQ6641532.1 MFS transporter [Saccharopolyspora sp.]
MSGSPLLAALSGARVGRLHRRVLLTVSVMFFFDLADLNSFAFAAPAIRRAHDFSVHDVAWVTGVGFAGMAVGAILGGRLTDLLGRRAGMLWSVVLFSAGSLMNALITGVGLMAVARFATGIGLGALTTVAITYLSEVTPAEKRGRFQSIALGTGLIGIPVVAFLARGLTGTHPESWRLLFLFGALGFLLIPMLLRLPESPRWLLTRGRYEEAAAIVRRFAPEHTGNEQQPAEEPPRARMADLFAPGMRRNTIALMVVWLFALVGFYGFQSWIPTLLADHGQDFAKSLTMSALTTVGAVPGAFLAWPFIDRFSRKKMATVLGLIVTALGVGYGLADNSALIVVFGVLVAALTQTYIAVLYSYTPEVFPTHLRTAGAGLGNGLGRIGNVVAPLVIATIYTTPSLGYAAVFVFISGCWLVATATLALFGVETKRTSLEQLHEGRMAPDERSIGA